MQKKDVGHPYRHSSSGGTEDRSVIVRIRWDREVKDLRVKALMGVDSLTPERFPAKQESRFRNRFQ